MRITTGGDLPAGADAVVIQEQVRVSGKAVTAKGGTGATYVRIGL